MSSSLTLTDAAALQAFVRTYDFNLLGRMFHGFASGPFLTPHANVKGQLVLTEMVVGDLVRRWKKTFEPTEGAFAFKPRTLTVVPAKIDLELYPQEFASTYLGHAQRPGFNALDNPFEGYMLGKTLDKMKNEQDVAAWLGDAAAVAADDDNMSELFDGYLKIIADGLTAGDISVVATGALTLADMVEQTEMVYNALPSEMRMKMVYIYMSVDNWSLYQQSYRENYSKNYMQKTVGGLELIRLDGGNAWIVPVPGMGTSDRIIATTADNMHYGFDLESDQALNFKDDIRCIKMWSDFKFGVQIGLLHDWAIKVNNQA